jgi:hypothetical protein
MENGGSVSAIGASTNVLEGTSVYGRYEIGNAIAGNRNVVSIGLRNRMKITDDVTGNIGYEKTKSLEQRLGQTPTDDHSAYFVSMEYLPKRPLKVSTKAEFGEDSRSTKSNFGIAADYRFEQDLSVILKYRNTDENDVKTSNYRSLDHLIVGFAFRPARYNWLNAVGKFEIKRDNNHYIQPFIDYGASIASIHAYVEPAHRLEVGMKYAFKVSQESSQDFSAIAHTNFILLRAEYDLLDYLDIGGEFRTLHQVEVGDYVNGYSLDAGYVVAKNFQIRAGYNFKGYKERDLVPYSLWSNGPFISGSFKFGEDLFGY